MPGRLKGTNSDISKLLDDLTSLPVELDERVKSSLVKYINLFARWNERLNFSQSKTATEILTNLIVPSMCFSILVKPDLNLLDLGSGPGIPGIPLKLVLPDLTLSIIEVNQKCCEFLKTVKSDLNINKLDIIEGRAEEIAHSSDLRASFDAVIARSFSSLPVLLETASPFIKTGGTLIIQCSKKESSLLHKKNENSIIVGATFQSVGAFEPESEEFEPVYYTLFKKVTETPDIYPRSWNKMKSKPLWL